MSSTLYASHGCQHIHLISLSSLLFVGVITPDMVVLTNNIADSDVPSIGDHDDTTSLLPSSDLNSDPIPRDAKYMSLTPQLILTTVVLLLSLMTFVTVYRTRRELIHESSYITAVVNATDYQASVHFFFRLQRHSTKEERWFLLLTLLLKSRYPSIPLIYSNPSSGYSQPMPTYPESGLIFVDDYDFQWISQAVPANERHRLVFGPMPPAFNTSPTIDLTGSTAVCENLDQFSLCRSTLEKLGATCVEVTLSETDRASRQLDVIWSASNLVDRHLDHAITMQFRPILWGGGDPSSTFADELRQCPVIFEPSLFQSGMGDQVISYSFFLEVATSAHAHWNHQPLKSHFDSFMNMGMNEPDISAMLLQLGLRPEQLLTVQLKPNQTNIMNRRWFDNIQPLKTLVAAFCESSPYPTPENITDKPFSINRDNHKALLVKGFPIYPLDDLPPCNPRMYAAYRRKYCMSRVIQPVPLYPPFESTNAATLDVAVHFRAGDLADAGRGGGFNKHWNVEDLLVVLTRLDVDLLRIISERRFIALDSFRFHVFSQSPKPRPNKTAVTWQKYFEPISQAFINRTDRVVWHVDVKSELTFDALVRAPLLIRSSSGFALAASMFRTHGFEMTNEKPSCFREHNTIRVNLDTGEYDSNRVLALLTNYYDSQGGSFRPTKFISSKQCMEQ